jgi:tRNA pseudouridine32 synthase/23S rRNA pseudouridine746 synthase
MLDRIDYSIWHKPAGLMSQGSPFGDHCALTRRIEARFPPRRAVYLVHRLDREVPGLIIVAHGKNAAARLSEMLRENRIQKRYKARVKGDLRPFAAKGEITLPLDGRPAITTFEVISYDETRNTSTAGIEIRTGRRHQIRRHFDLIGHPVMGDPRYGRNNSDLEGLQLTADFLSFDCPLGGERIEVSVEFLHEIR